MQTGCEKGRPAAVNCSSGVLVQGQTSSVDDPRVLAAVQECLALIEVGRPQSLGPISRGRIARPFVKVPSVFW